MADREVSSYPCSTGTSFLSAAKEDGGGHSFVAKASASQNNKVGA